MKSTIVLVVVAIVFFLMGCIGSNTAYAASSFEDCQPQLLVRRPPPPPPRPPQRPELPSMPRPLIAPILPPQGLSESPPNITPPLPDETPQPNIVPPLQDSPIQDYIEEAEEGQTISAGWIDTGGILLTSVIVLLSVVGIKKIRAHKNKAPKVVILEEMKQSKRPAQSKPRQPTQAQQGNLCSNCKTATIGGQLYCYKCGEKTS